MPRYYFNILKGETLEHDSEGTEIAEGEPLDEEALEAARDLLADGDLQGLDRREWVFEVADEAGTVVHTLLFDDAIEPDMPDAEETELPEAI
jgi:hypothetical protein